MNHLSYDTSKVPAVGEVQERFNPKPFFVYGTATNQNAPVSSSFEPVKFPPSTKYNSPVYLPTASPSDIPPVSFVSTTEAKPHEDPYTSPYSSYNPPPKSNESDDSYEPGHNPMDSTQDDDSYAVNQHESEVDYSSHVDTPKMKDQPVEDEIKYKPFDEYSHQSYFPEQDDSGDQPDHHVNSEGFKEVHFHHPPPGYIEDVPPMATTLSGHFPHYLYDDANSDHNHYDEIEKPKEQKRVSKPQYSYYYIDRKLWYIPLYFSVYFIIYVTFLILKSIARHKIQFKHDFMDHHSRESRKFTDSSVAEDLHDIHRNVTAALEDGEKRFPLVVM
ncbi:uncharacterized protein LOC123322049 isoform X2 [Coccinella septempunctata]|nr:uncharacterized protein LOC123322049 isoform X2 [Coccinella septempunctata]